MLLQSTITFALVLDSNDEKYEQDLINKDKRQR